jgi:hypothetical protein
MGDEERTASEFEFLTADAEELREAAFRLRYRVYVEEMGKTLGDADHRRRLLTDDLDESAVIFCATSRGGEPAATIRVNIGCRGLPPAWENWFGLKRFAGFGEEGLSFSSKLIVAPEWRSSMVLAEMLNGIYRFGLGQGIRFNFCDCAPGLVRFYERLGYRRYTRNFVDPEVGYRVPMVLLLEDTEYLKAVHSPFWRIARREVKTSPPSEWFSREFAVQTGHRPQRMASSEELWLFFTDRLHDESVPLFQDLEEVEIRALMKEAAVLKSRAGDWIVRRGDPGSEMFVLMEGAAEVRAGEGDSKVAIEYLGKGDVFGEMSFLSHLPRSADVVALTNVEILVLSQPFLQKIVESRPESAARLLLNLSLILCRRLRMSTIHWLGALGDDRSSES